MDLREKGQLTPEEVASHWYCRSRYELLRRHLDRLPSRIRQGTLVDFGCGDGLCLDLLAEDGFMEVDRMSGIDSSPERVSHSPRRRVPIEGDWSSNRRYDLILAMDVLEHCDDDAEVLRAIAAHCEKGGYVYLTVPALRWMWSAHDRFLMHRRRYNWRDLTALLRNSPNLRLCRMHFHYGMVLPPAAFYRWIRRSAGSPASSDLKRLPGWLNRCLLALEWFELSFCEYNRIGGLTLVALCQRI